jgi:hypothetical protein
MDLTLVLQNNQNAGVVWVGISGRQLGKLPPSESMDLKLNVIATIPGLQVQANILPIDNYLLYNLYILHVYHLSF